MGQEEKDLGVIPFKSNNFIRHCLMPNNNRGNIKKLKRLSLSPINGRTMIRETPKESTRFRDTNFASSDHGMSI